MKSLKSSSLLKVSTKSKAEKQVEKLHFIEVDKVGFEVGFEVSFEVGFEVEFEVEFEVIY